MSDVRSATAWTTALAIKQADEDARAREDALAKTRAEEAERVKVEQEALMARLKLTNRPTGRPAGTTVTDATVGASGGGSLAEEDAEEALRNAAYSGDLATLKRLTEEGVNLEAASDVRRPASGAMLS